MSKVKRTSEEVPVQEHVVILVAELASKWNQIKLELIAMWEIVNEVRKEAPVRV